MGPLRVAKYAEEVVMLNTGQDILGREDLDNLYRQSGSPCSTIPACLHTYTIILKFTGARTLNLGLKHALMCLYGSRSAISAQPLTTCMYMHRHVY